MSDLYGLFPVYICGKDIGILLLNLFEVKIFNPFLPFTSSSSPLSGGIGGTSVDSSSFSDHTYNHIHQEIDLQDHI